MKPSGKWLALGLTHANLCVLGRMMRQHQRPGGTVGPLREWMRSDRHHVKRLLATGLLSITRGRSLVPTELGHEAFNEWDAEQRLWSEALRASFMEPS